MSKKSTLFTERERENGKGLAGKGKGAARELYKVFLLNLFGWAGSGD